MPSRAELRWVQTGGDHFSNLCGFRHGIRDSDVVEEITWIDAVFRVEGHLEDDQSNGHDSR